jgi:diaminohydroxyphosphoribosylaminopyrimidine deaminase / 5-amino-6-(5-phosphoribosylamino)uracil reductase
LSISEFDRQQLRAALELARGSFGLTDPNPRVGCIVGHADGRICGQGATQAAGSHHAEVMALQDAAAAGHDTRGATAWVSLEPCAHFGRTPPCCDTLVAAGIARCVVALLDPNPLVAGQGLARMRAAGIVVDVVPPEDEVAQESRELNLGFFSRIERGRPWVRAKTAVSADARTALPDGRSKWITGEAARADGHRWRKRASAVLTGIGTVLADNPRLDVRAVPTPRQPLRIVLDTQLRLPLDAALLAAPGAVLVVAATGHTAAAEALRRAGAEVWDDWPEVGKPTLPLLLARLAERGVNEIHLEAGPTLTGAFHTAGLIDEWLIYIAPTLLGAGRPMLETMPLPSLAHARRGRWAGMTVIGDDLRLRLWA